MPELSQGIFISFEGGEGVGKTTQIELLVKALEKQGYKVKHFREPGGTKIGEAIRSITHNPTNAMLDNRAEALLFAASRAQIVTELYKPYLADNYIVIADRYVDSSYVYQGIARGLGYGEIKTINEFAINGLMPDLTVLLDLPYEVGQRRRYATDKIDRMDMQTQEFYQKVDEGYRFLAEQFKGRIVCLDADRPIETVHHEICTLVQNQINAAK